MVEHEDPIPGGGVLHNSQGWAMPGPEDVAHLHLEQTGGWCAPSACAAGICRVEEEHEPGCAEPGLAYKAWDRVDLSMPPLELPKITVKRGGIRWPLFWVGVKVFSRREGFWRRKRWYVEITERRMEHVLTDIVGPLSESAARHVKKAVDAMVAMHNDMHAEEADRWSRS